MATFVTSGGINDLLRHVLRSADDELKPDRGLPSKQVHEDAQVPRKPCLALDDDKPKDRERYEITTRMYSPLTIPANSSLERAYGCSQQIAFHRSYSDGIIRERRSTRIPGSVCLSGQHPVVRDGKRKVDKGKPINTLEWVDVLRAFELNLGTLSEWDLGLVDANIIESLFRTGTTAFFARDFLLRRKIEHFERHEMESFFYVLVWNITCYENGKKKKTCALADWTSTNNGHNHNSKLCFVFDPNSRRVPEGTFNGLYRHWILRLVGVFFGGLAAKCLDDIKARLEPGKALIDDETFGGNITYEKLWAILKEDLREE